MKIAVIGGGPAGLYLSLLVKKSDPSHEVEVFERNRADDTFGWGVVFSNETLGHFKEADPETFARITESFAHWEAIDTIVGGRTIRSGGHGFSGIARRRLLQILQERCAGLGVKLNFQHELDGLPQADVVVAADGINSKTRTAHEDVFQPSIEPGKARFIWLGTTRRFDAFTFIIRETEHGLFQVHAYPFDRETSTFIVETDPETWRRAGLDAASVDESVAFLERLFAPELEGHRLMTNNSSWISFRTIACKAWWHGNLVLIGDAAHTAHFSIGSGTKLAMEDAIALAAALRQHPGDIPAALAAYHEARWLEVAKLQRAARVSQAWFEDIARYRHMAPEQLVLSMMTRSKRVTHGNLRVRDPGYIAAVDEWFARAAEASTPTRTPPMFTGFRLRGLQLRNRVVVSSMCMYSATDGLADEWHLVHLGARAVGGAGLVMTEMTDVSPTGRITPGCTGLWTGAQAAAWRRVTEFVHAHSGAKIGVQIAHAGRKGATQNQWDRPDVPLPAEQAWELLAPSAIAWAPGFQVPRAMTAADMDAVTADFVRATEHAEAAGFDLLEIHMAHGYLLSSFISPLTNQREDAFGGSLENRMRFPRRVFAAVRAAWPADRPMSVRISAHDWAPGGLTGEDAVVIARMLKDDGCDLIDVSSGQTTPQARPVYGRMFQTHFSDAIRNEVGIATIAVGNIQDWDQINTIVASGRADLCALARPHLVDPQLTLRAAAEQGYVGEGVVWPKQYLAARPVVGRGE